jgi:branched-subunit amino acid aminotransferase/4-amino-4-deoxychorismate lyase
MGKTPKMELFRDASITCCDSTARVRAMNVIRERSELNGEPARAEDLRTLALFNYGHFTSMQVRAGAVRGLDLHMDRLDRATRELFACPLDLAAVRGHMRTILGGEQAPLSLRVNIFSRQLKRDRLAEPAEPDVLVTTGPARAVDIAPLRLKTFRHERVLAHIKHVGTFGLFHHQRLAQLEGFDDALFVDSGDAVSEGSIWNVGFFDGTSVVWPEAEMLAGISMQLLQRGLRERGIATACRRIARADIPAYRSAFFTNSACAVRPVAAIDATDFAVDADLMTELEACYAANPWQPI